VDGCGDVTGGRVKVEFGAGAVEDAETVAEVLETKAGRLAAFGRRNPRRTHNPGSLPHF
jgi:hypothetical protein